VKAQRPAQSTAPGAHTHTPALQDLPPLHAAPQAPQFSESIPRLTQRPPQLTVPDGHPQVPPEHTSPEAQACPQLPQFSASLFRS
jgi:hypothetical protein